MNRFLRPVATIGVVGAVLSLTTNPSKAAALTPVDFDTLNLGAKIVGPVGPEVETTFITTDGVGLGDLISSVSCPAGFASCLPPTNPAGTLYTYLHQVTTGVNSPNDAPFPDASSFKPITGEVFRLNFPAAGFNGVAGYSFSEAATALDSDDALTVEETEDGSLVWSAPADAGWAPLETVSFFWQTTQNPSGPGGIYELSGDGESGMANGPLPAPVAVVTPPATEVPEPSAIASLALVGAALILCRRSTHSDAA
ncbi:MAG: PEP-CTERM sorting domain-containing protein [Cyanobacteria bacterium J06634_5]